LQCPAADGYFVERGLLPSPGRRISVSRARADFYLEKDWSCAGGTADALEPFMDESSEVVARGTVRAVYAPADRDEAAVTVEIKASTAS